MPLIRPLDWISWISFLIFLFSPFIIKEARSDCSSLNYCNGHGTCNGNVNLCICDSGYGAPSDVTQYRAPDCSARSCPSHRAWTELPTPSGQAHSIVECSNRGTCDRNTGTCSCFSGFTGPACQRSICPNDCSGRGKCISMREIARLTEAQPLTIATYYGVDNLGVAWDADMIYGCVCDSSWPVGLGPGQVQQPEWFGPDCSLRHCPSGDDPLTGHNETNCNSARNAANPGVPIKIPGAKGNLCQVDCSNRGICDYATGLCSCFDNFYGSKCNIYAP